MQRSIVALLFVLILALVSASTPAADEPPMGGLVAWYPFNGSADDSSGNGHDGTVVGAALCPDRFGTPGNAYTFDGDGDYIEVNHASGLVFGTGDFSVCCWVKIATIQAPDVALVNKMAAAPTGPQHGDSYGYALALFGDHAPYPDGAPYFNVQQAGTGNPAYWDHPLNVDMWYFIVGVRESGLLKLYVNGCLRATADNPRDTDSEAALIIGADIAVGDERYLDGCLDDILIYERALSEGEIADLWGGEPSSTWESTWGSIKRTYE